MTKIPQRVLWKTQNEIVNVLWARRPHWRSRLLVLGIVATPHRTEPQLARAYAAVIDFVRFLNQMPSAIQTCRDLQSNQPWPRESLIWQLAEALKTLGLTLQPGLCISFRGSEHTPLFDMNHRDIAKPLQYLAKQKCYSDAASSKRRDISKCSSIFDPDLSSLFTRKSRLHLDSSIPNQIFFESVQTGCNLTNDRLFRAELVESPKCRLCNCAKENWAHLVHECPGVASAISRPPNHELGINFPMFGLCTHPRSVALQRLQTSSMGAESTSFDAHITELYWTDGSVQWGSYFWLATGAYAIVDARFQIVESGRVSHWELSAYTTELYALLRVIRRATCCIQVKSDCQSLVDQFADLTRLKQVPESWSHRPWWLEICRVLLQRQEHCVSPIEVLWTPSHLLEQLPGELISEAAARECGSTARDILANRVADKEANRLATILSPIHPRDQRILESAVLHRHEWLVMLNWLLDTTQPSPTVSKGPKASAESPASIVSRFPQWEWATPKSAFPWKPKIFAHQLPPARWTHTDDDWRECRNFLNNLRWRIDMQSCVATTELACLFWWRGHRHSQLEAGVSFYHHLILAFRSMLRFACDIEHGQIFPGDLVATETKHAGRALPKGIISGAAIYMTDDERKQLVHLFDVGAARALSTFLFWGLSACAAILWPMATSFRSFSLAMLQSGRSCDSWTDRDGVPGAPSSS